MKRGIKKVCLFRKPAEKNIKVTPPIIARKICIYFHGREQNNIFAKSKDSVKNTNFLIVYIYIYICVCVCVCVC